MLSKEQRAALLLDVFLSAVANDAPALLIRMTRHHSELQEIRDSLDETLMTAVLAVMMLAGKPPTELFNLLKVCADPAKELVQQIINERNEEEKPTESSTQESKVNSRVEGSASN